jgi:CheY-like chemotaxis protein
MAAILRRIIGDDVRLITTLDADVPPVRSDRGQLEQLVLNLVVNARDAVSGRGVIRIETHEREIRSPLTSYGLTVPAGRYVVVTVSDTGCGMSEDTKARLFEPFFTTKPHGVGTGLGLATIYGILAQGGGLMEVNSEPGAGASFDVYLPQHEGPIAPPQMADVVLSEGGSETILLAEDEDSVRMLARRILQGAGYTVIEAPNSAEARRHAESTGIDLLLADVMMPGGSGPELYRALHASRPELRVLFMSGYAERHLFEGAEIPQAAAFLAKPFTVEGLLRKVREVLASDRGERR